MFETEFYNFDLPEELIAQTPAPERDCSRLMTVDRKAGIFEDHLFYELPELLSPGDLLVVNNTKVVPARLYGKKDSGGHVEVLVLDHPVFGMPLGETRKCLIRAAKRPRIGSTIELEEGLTCVVEDIYEDGLVSLRFIKGEVDNIIDRKGGIPLPPYIVRENNDRFALMDRDRYQTVYAETRGSVAAPTAGLHFTDRLISLLKNKKIEMVNITLHVGYGTFRPVRTVDIRNHELGEELYHIGTNAAEAINETKKRGGRVIAVGTTVIRTLETVGADDGIVKEGLGSTGLLITPGYKFKVIDGIITNFHLPKSSLLFLVSAFAGIGLTKDFYNYAVAEKYRFYSYGDASLII